MNNLFKNMRVKIIFLVLTLFISTGVYSQNWNEIIKANASDAESNDSFGFSVSISGNYALIGAPSETPDLGAGPLTNAGSAYIFERDGSGNWNEVQKINASDAESGDNFGATVSISGDYAIIVARYEAPDLGSGPLTNAGSAYIFERDGAGNWNEVQKINASDAQDEDRFGISISISGNYAIVGANQEDPDLGSGPLTDAGSAYIFERDGAGNWNEVQKINASDAVGYDNYGRSVSISGDYAIVGANLNDPDLGAGPVILAGSAYLYERDGAGNWNEVQKINASDGEFNDQFGISTSISGNYAIVGAYFENPDLGAGPLSDAGSAYIFERDVAGNWNEVQKINASDAENTDKFGSSVSISGARTIVGTNLEDPDLGAGALNNAGSAYLFERDGTGNWNEVQKINASDAELNDYFGYSVSISGDYAISGAISEDPDLGAGPLNNAGSAYIYEKPPCLPTASSFSVGACGSYSTPSGNTSITISDPVVMDTIPNSCGADSVMTINVTIIPLKTGSITSTICAEDTVMVNGTAYHASNSSGTEVFTNVGPFLCDSTVTINLNVLPALTGNNNTTICATGSVIINGTTYNAANQTGTEVFTNIGSNLCDSTVTVSLNVLLALTGSVTNTICEGDTIIVNGTAYHQGNLTGTEVFTNVGPYLCDSTVNINLTLQSIDNTTNTSGLTITANQTGATYQWIDCNNSNTAISGETNASFTATANGDYAVVITVGICSDTSACVNINSVGIYGETLMNNIQLYPNPTTGKINIDFGETQFKISVSLINSLGQVLATEYHDSTNYISFNTDAPKGVYFIKIKRERALIFKKMIIE